VTEGNTQNELERRADRSAAGLGATFLRRCGGLIFQRRKLTAARAESEREPSRRPLPAGCPFRSDA